MTDVLGRRRTRQTMYIAGAGSMFRQARLGRWLVGSLALAVSEIEVYYWPLQFLPAHSGTEPCEILVSVVS